MARWSRRTSAGRCSGFSSLVTKARDWSSQPGRRPRTRRQSRLCARARRACVKPSRPARCSRSSGTRPATRCSARRTPVHPGLGLSTRPATPARASWRPFTRRIERRCRHRHPPHAGAPGVRRHLSLPAPRRRARGGARGNRARLFSDTAHDGRPARADADITDRKQAEEALRESGRDCGSRRPRPESGSGTGIGTCTPSGPTSISACSACDYRFLRGQLRSSDGAGIDPDDPRAPADHPSRGSRSRRTLALASEYRTERAFGGTSLD